MAMRGPVFKCSAILKRACNENEGRILFAVAGLSGSGAQRKYHEPESQCSIAFEDCSGRPISEYVV